MVCAWPGRLRQLSLEHRQGSSLPLIFRVFALPRTVKTWLSRLPASLVLNLMYRGAGAQGWLVCTAQRTLPSDS